MGNISDKLKAIGAAVNTIEKQFGKGSIMTLEGGPSPEIPVLSSGSIGLDLALGVGGLPRGRVIEIFGGKEVGKTTLTLHTIAAAQRAGGVCAFIDAEHALDVSYAKRLGVDLEHLLVSQPDCGEQALEIAHQLVLTGAIDLVVVDSVAALVPKAEIEGETSEAHLELQARLMSQALRKLTAVASRQNTIVIFINPAPSMVGNALKFYSTVRIDMRQADNRIKVKVVKNKVAPPFREAVFDIRPGEGIDTIGEIVDACLAHGVVEKIEAWFVLDGERIGQTRDKAREWLWARPDKVETLRARILKGA